LVIILFCFSCKKEGGSAMKTFGPVVAGSFYPAGKNDLKGMVEEYINSAEVEEINGRILGIISPHAGYIYSGKVAGYGFKLLLKVKPSRVVILAPSHRYPTTRASVINADYYKTPLGDVPIDVEAVKKLLNYKDVFIDDPRVYSMEHSLEVQLPFLQVVLKNFKIVPIVLGQLSSSTIKNAGSYLFKEFGEDPKTVFVISSDMSHYFPYDEAVEMDKRALDLLSKLDPFLLLDEDRKERIQFCGIYPIAVFLEYLSNFKNPQMKVLKYLNSGDTAGDKSHVVGYSAVAFYQPSVSGGKGELHIEPLTDEDKKELLIIARKTLTEYVKNRRIPEIEVKRERNKKIGAAFVTLKIKGELRGCIGRLISDMPLYKTVQEMTVHSCSKDPRFFPVRPEELNDIDIEISVLSDMIKVENPEEIVVGRDGLLVKRGFYQGVLLPQVPVEENWDRDTFLKMVCRKAGLPPDCIGKEGTELYRFEAVVFSEKEMGLHK
jgi:AmmeMemoRadiSam system protein B/AmmeMemoRadiSam system protein A